MTSRKQFALLFSLVFAACLVFLLLFSGPGIFAPSKPSVETLNPQITEAERRQRFALQDLQETRAEIAKMKAHGIGMPVSSQPSGLVKDSAQR